MSPGPPGVYLTGDWNTAFGYSPGDLKQKRLRELEAAMDAVVRARDLTPLMKAVRLIQLVADHDVVLRTPSRQLYQGHPESEIVGPNFGRTTLGVDWGKDPATVLLGEPSVPAPDDEDELNDWRDTVRYPSKKKKEDE